MSFAPRDIVQDATYRFTEDGIIQRASSGDESILYWTEEIVCRIDSFDNRSLLVIELKETWPFKSVRLIPVYGDDFAKTKAEIEKFAPHEHPIRNALNS